MNLGGLLFLWLRAHSCHDLQVGQTISHQIVLGKDQSCAVENALWGGWGFTVTLITLSDKTKRNITFFLLVSLPFHFSLFSPEGILCWVDPLSSPDSACFYDKLIPTQENTYLVHLCKVIPLYGQYSFEKLSSNLPSKRNLCFFLMGSFRLLIPVHRGGGRGKVGGKPRPTAAQWMSAQWLSSHIK